MGKSAFDVAALLDIIAPGPTSYLQSMSKSPTDIAVGAGDDTMFTIDDEERIMYREAVKLLQNFIKCDDIYIEGHNEMAEQDYGSATYKATQRAEWKEYLEGCEGDLRTLSDVVDWHEAHPVGNSFSSPSMTSTEPASGTVLPSR